MSIKRGLNVLLFILLVVTLMACGGNKTQDSPRYGNTSGKVGVLLKDSPSAFSQTTSPDLTSDMSQLWVTVNKVSLKLEGEGEEEDDEGLDGFEGTADMEEDEWLPVFEGTRKVDILKLDQNRFALLALVDVPAEKAGYYEKARLELDTAEGQNCFYKTPDPGVAGPSTACVEGTPYQFKVPSGRIDILFQPPIYLGNGQDQYIVFDFLPAESIHMTETGMAKPDSYILRPVIHAYTMPDITVVEEWVETEGAD